MKMEVCEGEVTLRLDKYSNAWRLYENKNSIKGTFHSKILQHIDTVIR